jgi:hypothetical protein
VARIGHINRGLYVADHPDTSAQAQRLGTVLKTLQRPHRELRL